MGGAGTGMRAFTRPVPDSIQHCELTHVERLPIDLGRARLQHAAYEHALAQMGCIVQPVPAAHDMPDSVFIEDTAVVFDDIAVLARPGRRVEAARVGSGCCRPYAISATGGDLRTGDA